MYSINLLVLIIFIVLSVFLVKVLKSPHKWIGLLVTSGAFYLYYAEGKVLIPIIIWLFTYSSGKLLKNKLPLWLIISIIIIPLLVFKLTVQGNHFESFTVSDLAIKQIGWTQVFHIIGISYFTFLALSYLFDVKKGFVKAENNPFRLLLYLIYFPTIFSGPLHRYNYLSSQFKQIRITDSSISSGLRLILWGLLKNLVIAPRLFAINYNLLSNGISGYYYLISGLIFFLYLFINFSSFIDLFQGVSQLFNIRLKNNFGNRVYLSHSRQHFWNQWHITLNEWFRDYFFFPLAKRDRKRSYIDFILLITFILIALWHELSFVMALWGILNGLWIVLEKKVPFHNWPKSRIRKISGTFYHLMLASVLAMVFITPSIYSIKEKLLTKAYFPTDQISFYSIIAAVFWFLFMDFIVWKAKNIRIDQYLEQQHLGIRWSVYFLITFSILLFGKSSQIENYYIQF